VPSNDAMPAHVEPPESLAYLHPVFVGLAGPDQPPDPSPTRFCLRQGLMRVVGHSGQGADNGEESGDSGLRGTQDPYPQYEKLKKSEAAMGTDDPKPNPNPDKPKPPPDHGWMKKVTVRSKVPRKPRT